MFSSNSLKRYLIEIGYLFCIKKENVINSLKVSTLLSPIFPVITSPEGITHWRWCILFLRFFFFCSFATFVCREICTWILSYYTYNFAMKFFGLLFLDEFFLILLDLIYSFEQLHSVVFHNISWVRHTVMLCSYFTVNQHSAIWILCQLYTWAKFAYSRCGIAGL